MPAQSGQSIVLSYGPQGARQSGGGVVLAYGASAVARRLVGGVRSPWGGAKAVQKPVKSVHAAARTDDPARSSRWGSGRGVSNARTSAWVAPAEAIAVTAIPWSAVGRAVQPEAVSAWVPAAVRESARRSPWAGFGRPVQPEAGSAWAAAAVRELLRGAPWGGPMVAHGAGVVVLLPRARAADRLDRSPWSLYSRRLAPGWGVVIPSGQPPVDENGTVLVLVRKVYMTVNNLTLVRASDGAPIQAYTLGMSLDADSWTWSWQATLHASALPLIQPGPGGDPVEVLATVNGMPIRLCAEAWSRERSFGSTRISVRGRGRAAILDAPYAPALNHGNATARTAQQLMADVLTINGVGIGWNVAWGITDWLVPGGVWTHQGSYISAILDIADAAGAYVQPHDTAATLRILPRYPAAPWQWHTLTPDFELPSSVVAVEGIEWQRKAPYNRVHVSGTSAGVLGEVTRAGTAGDVVAPMVTHPLITHADAARQRGLAVLGDTGQQARISLRLPVLEETGVIKPGALVRYVDGATTHLGLVRGTSLEWQAPKLRQVLTVEAHPA